MPEILVIRDADHPWREPAPEWLAQQKRSDPGLVYKSLLPHAPGMPNVQRTRYHPRHHEAPHSHPEDELICVIGGAIHFGRQQLGAGDVVFVPRDKTYSLRAGDDGAEFIRVGLSDLHAG